MARGRKPTGRRTKMCRMPDDVVQKLGSLARLLGVSIPDIGDTVIRETIRQTLASMKDAERKHILSEAKKRSSGRHREHNQIPA